MPECVECGSTVSEEDAIQGSGALKTEGVERLLDGDDVGASALFEFDDGPYCSMDCVLA